MKTVAQVQITEVGPRDGLQNEKKPISVQDKIEFIETLISAGLESIEIGSFVKPEAVPQMANTDKVLKHLVKKKMTDKTRCIVLVPNLKGLEQAIDCGVKDIAVFTATSETFNQKNIRCSVLDSLKNIEAICVKAKQAQLRIRGYVSTAFGCPYEGMIEPEKVLEVARPLSEMFSGDIILGDTTAMAHPKNIEAVLLKMSEHFNQDRVGLHFHDTYNMGLLNAYTAFKKGFYKFDASAGGLGGCPFAKGASGNLATEDLLQLFKMEGVPSNINMEKVTQASSGIFKVLGRGSLSKVHQFFQKGQELNADG